jgi:hypothetical protein
MQKFRVTYEIVTPESSEDGEVEERGFVLPGEWNIDLESALKDKTGDYTADLRSALRLCCPSEDCGAWFAESDGREDYRTGAIETRSLHPPGNITAASYRRLRRLLRIRQ